MYGILMTAGLFFGGMTIISAATQGSPAGVAFGVALILAFAVQHFAFRRGA